jgi:hypothetical protein
MVLEKVTALFLLLFAPLRQMYFALDVYNFFFLGSISSFHYISLVCLSSQAWQNSFLSQVHFLSVTSQQLQEKSSTLCSHPKFLEPQLGDSFVD